MTTPQPAEPRRDTDAQAAHERLDMNYPVELDRVPDAGRDARR